VSEAATLDEERFLASDGGRSVSANHEFDRTRINGKSAFISESSSFLVCMRVPMPDVHRRTPI
jgi:hypothetical protein